MQDNEPKVAREVAEAELGRWAEAMDLDWIGPQAEDFKSHKGRLVKGIMDGSVTISGDGEVLTFTPRRSKVEALEFRAPMGDAQLAFDAHKVGEMVHRTYEFLGRMTGKSIAFFANKMDDRDMKICDSVATLYLGL